jgi:hypothetical protein
VSTMSLLSYIANFRFWLCVKEFFLNRQKSALNSKFLALFLYSVAEKDGKNY